MKKSIIAAFLFIALSFCSTEMFAQKFGYLNSAQLLLELPEVKAADSQLQAYQEELMVRGQQMVKDLENKYNAYMAEANAGSLSAIQMQQKEGELTTKQQEIQQYEVEVQNQIIAKREELYQPILDKVNKIIEAIGKEENYTMIFDTSVGGLLSADEDHDLIQEVKSRLGI